MPLDAVFLKGLVNELAPELEGARIDKVQQPEKDMLLLSLYTRSGCGRKLLLSASTVGARMHFTQERYENPVSAPMFCMLMRKHLCGAAVTGITQPPNERTAVISLKCRDELGRESRKTLVCEMMGRNSNILLVDADGCIIDCMRRADFGEEAYRRLLPGMKYKLPPKPEKPCFFELTGAQRAEILRTRGGGERPLTEFFSGISPLTAREIEYRAGTAGNLPAAMDALAESAAAGELSPYLLTEDGKAKDFSFMAVRQYGESVKSEKRDSFSELLDDFYAERTKKERVRRITGDTVKTVRTLRDRQRRKLEQQRLELSESAERGELLIRGELIRANLWKIKKGDSSFTCENYFEEGSPEVTVQLDPLKTPAQNADSVFKKYKKMAAAEKHLNLLIADGEKRLDYLESVLDELSRAESEAELADIRRELLEAGIISRGKNGKAKKEKTKPGTPLSYRAPSGLEILVGRNNMMNDELTLKKARRADLWFHARDYHGSHVILRCSESEVSEEDVKCAAGIAAYYSQARDNGKVPVDCTRVKFVKKPAGSMPGRVIYTDYRTVSAVPALPGGNS